jgi:hypothetical protein
MIVSSGAGHHFYWELDTAVEPTHADAINSGLALRLGGDKKSRDISRVLRNPGFVNHKYGYAVELIAAHDYRYTPDDFSHLAAPLDVAPPRNSPSTIDIPHVSRELRARFCFELALDRGLSRAFRGEIGDGSSDSRYAMFARLMATGKFTPEEVAALIVERRWWNTRNKAVCPAERVFRDAQRLLGLFSSAEQTYSRTHEWRRNENTAGITNRIG